MHNLRSNGCLRAAALLLSALVLAACSSTGTRVTLMPDQDGHVGAAVVANAHGQARLDQAYARVEAIGDAAPRLLAPGDRQAFERTHRALLDAQPTPPRTFVLHFRFDSMELTAESRALLPQVLDTVRGRLPTEVTVFGHADAAGAADYNLALSAQRAQAVADVLKKIAPDLPVRVQYFGDRDPLVPTPPGVAEPRNRRAEILIL